MREIVISNLIKALCTSEEHSRQFSWKPNKSTLPINVDWGNLCKNKPLVFDFQRNEQFSCLLFKSNMCQCDHATDHYETQHGTPDWETGTWVKHNPKVIKQAQVKVNNLISISLACALFLF